MICLRRHTLGVGHHVLLHVTEEDHDHPTGEGNRACGEGWGVGEWSHLERCLVLTNETYARDHAPRTRLLTCWPVTDWLTDLT